MIRKRLLDGHLEHVIEIEDALKQYPWVVITTPDCGYCSRAIDLLKSRAVRYRSFTMPGRDDPEWDHMAAWLQKFMPERKRLDKPSKSKDKQRITFPMVFNNEKYIGGYTQLSNLLDLDMLPAVSSLHMRRPKKRSQHRPADMTGDAWTGLIIMLYFNARYNNNCTPITKRNITSTGKITDKGHHYSNWSDLQLVWSGPHR